MYFRRYFVIFLLIPYHTYMSIFYTQHVFMCNGMYRVIYLHVVWWSTNEPIFMPKISKCSLYVMETLTHEFNKVWKGIHCYISFNNKYIVYPYSMMRNNLYMCTIMELCQNKMIKGILNFTCHNLHSIKYTWMTCVCDRRYIKR